MCVCPLLPSSAWDDSAPLRDAVWQFLLRGQQAGDAQQGRLFLQRGAVVRATPPPCQPFPTPAVFPAPNKTLDDFTGTETSLCLFVPSTSLYQVFSCQTNRFLLYFFFLFFLYVVFFLAQVFLDSVSSVVSFGAACVHVGERRVWAAKHMQRLYMLLISLCYVWVPLDHQGERKKNQKIYIYIYFC